MRISLLCIGKTTDARLVEMMHAYEKKIPSQFHFQRIELNLNKKPKQKDIASVLKFEKEQLLNNLQNGDTVILLDDKGKEYSSTNFSKFLQEKFVSSTQHLVFVVGGAYGFHQEIYDRANHKVSLSRMTFTHQMVRLFFTEQLYRSFSILENKPYHHE